MTPADSPPPSPPGLTLATLSTAQVMVIDWPPETADGCFQYCYRLVGIVRRVAASEGRLGPILRLQGQFFALREGRTWSAPSLITADPIVSAVRAEFAEHPPSSTRDRIRVHLDFDLWAIREQAAPLGYRMHAQGRAWVPEPLSALIAGALARPVPDTPELS